MLTDFKNLFTDRLIRKTATESLLNISPRLKDVAALPCEISLFKKSLSTPAFPLVHFPLLLFTLALSSLAILLVLYFPLPYFQLLPRNICDY